MAALSKKDLERLLKKEPPLIEGWLDLEKQLQANGFDLTVRDIALPRDAGRMAVADNQRSVSTLSPLTFDGLGYMELIPGIYVITFNEIVHLPKDIMALGRPRSSLLRCGVTVGTAVWDAGYEGRSQALLVVYNTYGFRLQKNSRVLQLVFFKLTGETDGYNGAYQGENI